MTNKFSYEQDNHNFVLPIDHISTDISKEWGTTSKTMYSYLFEHPLLTDELYSVVYEKEKGTISSEEKHRKTPVLLEAEPFLHCFFDLASSPKYKGLSDIRAQPKLCRQFCGELCQNLSQTISLRGDNEANDSIAFCRHMLLQNDDFGVTVMKQKWEDEINVRVDQLQKLSQNVSLDVQVQALHDCLMVLDRICLTLIRAQTNDSASLQKAQPPMPADLLFDLLSARKAQIESSTTSKYVKYNIENIRIPKSSSDQNLEDAFKQLSLPKTRRNEKLLSLTRTDYLEYLNSNVSPSDFELKYIELCKYLNLKETELDERILTDKIAQAMKRACTPALLNCCNPTDYKDLPETPTNNTLRNYAEVFLEQTAKNHLANGWNIFGNTKELFESARTAVLFWEKISQSKDTFPQELWNPMEVMYMQHIQKNILEPFPTWFAQAYAFLNQKSFDAGIPSAWPMFEGKNKAEFDKNSKKAAIYFNMQTEFESSLSKLVDQSFPFGVGVYEISSLCNITSVFFESCFLILHRIVEDASLSVAQGIKLFSAR